MTRQVIRRRKIQTTITQNIKKKFTKW